eukprot:75019-Rhodomonas_salina.1
MVPEPDELLVHVSDTLQGETLEAIQAGKVDISIDFTHALSTGQLEQKEKYYSSSRRARCRVSLGFPDS